MQWGSGGGGRAGIGITEHDKLQTFARTTIDRNIKMLEVLIQIPNDPYISVQSGMIG